jgi:hypothetical protein
MTLPIANGLAGSAGQPLPEDAVCDWKGDFGAPKVPVCDWKGPIKGPFAIGRVAAKATVCDWERIPDLLANARTVGMKML